VNGGEFFDMSKAASNCVTAVPLDGADIDIQTEFESSSYAKRFDPQSESARNFRNFAKAILQVKNDDKADEELQKLEKTFHDLRIISGFAKVGAVVKNKTYTLRPEGLEKNTIIVYARFAEPTWDVNKRSDPEIATGKRVVFEGRWTKLTKNDEMTFIEMNVTELAEAL